MKRTRTGHHRVPQGAPVLVFMADGRIISDRFGEEKGNRLRFVGMGWVAKGTVSSVTIKKGGNWR